MKKLLLASLAVLAMGAQAAGTANQNFEVTATLSPNCVTNNANANPATLAFGTYTGFGSAVTVAPASGFTSKLDCSNNMSAPTVAVTGGNSGIVVGVAYTLNVGAVTVAAGVDSNQATNTAAEADVYSVSVGGGIAAGQPGEVGAPATHARVLVWSF